MLDEQQMGCGLPQPLSTPVPAQKNFGKPLYKAFYRNDLRKIVNPKITAGPAMQLLQYCAISNN
jgi:hypothetical protein